MNLKHPTIRAWLEDLSKRTVTDDDDEAIVVYALRTIGIPYRSVTCGLVYLNGIPNPVSLQTFAQQALSALREKGVIA